MPTNITNPEASILTLHGHSKTVPEWEAGGQIATKVEGGILFIKRLDSYGAEAPWVETFKAAPSGAGYAVSPRS